MTDEEIRVRLWAAFEFISPETAKIILASRGNQRNEFEDTPNEFADRLLTAHLEITKPLRDAADELAAALEKTVSAGNAYDMQCALMDGQAALARYRAVKGER